MLEEALRKVTDAEQRIDALMNKGKERNESAAASSGEF